MAGHKRRWYQDPEALLTIGCGIFFIISILPGVPVWVGYLAVACGGYFALIEAWESLSEKSIDVNLLMVLAAVGSIVVGHISDAAALLFLFSLSHTLEAMSLSKTESAIASLMKLKPEKALRISSDQDEEVAASQLAVGDRVRVLPFEIIPSDGELETSARIDESAMTGESRPVDLQAGSRVMAGTMNQDSMMVLRVTAAPGDTTLDKVVNLVQEAQDSKASGQRISDWFGQRYTLFVLGAFALVLVVRLILGQEMGSALYSALILLVALSPCALVISTPASTLSALAFAARRGILVRGGEFIEAAGNVDTIALDKTGTLTVGRPMVVEICLCAQVPETSESGTPSPGGVSTLGCARNCETCENIKCWHRGDTLTGLAQEALRYAATAELFSTHPIAEAIVAAARSHEVEIPHAEEHKGVPGYGVVAKVDETEVKIGQTKFFEDPSDALPINFREHVEEMQSRGLTSVLMKYGNRWACFGMQDAPRESAKEFVAALHRAGVKKIAMLTGDNESTAKAIAAEVGVDEVKAHLMPQDKSGIIEAWNQEGRSVMMVGDGVNDAPALALARVGIAMGGLGSEVALKAADVVLIQDRIERIPELIRLGKMANRVIRANLLFAAGMILTLTILSFFWGKMPFLAQISKEMPLPLAVVGHEGSTVLVILNGLRLLRGPGQ